MRNFISHIKKFCGIATTRHSTIQKENFSMQKTPGGTCGMMRSPFTLHRFP
ncbi:MAG: hypothetical protein ACO1OR_08175 [Hydrogenophaga sp.]|uniref:hypothetical protein n=1 Tax=Hydrogenophaga intermedia TaxID=65786 RepID=UPI002043F1FB|nr:hypothetical protein [Hydrogenophaga intermedia]MCM3562343.1 hypothetical protein [Hydrogenophaga intermedia]